MRHCLPADYVPSWDVTCRDSTPLGLLQNAEHAEQVPTNGLAVAVSAGKCLVYAAVSGSVDGLAHLWMPWVHQSNVSGVLDHQLRSSVQRTALLWRLAQQYPVFIRSLLSRDDYKDTYIVADVTLSTCCGSISQDGSPNQIVIIIVEDRCHDIIRRSNIVAFLPHRNKAERLKYHRAIYFRLPPSGKNNISHDASSRSCRIQDASFVVCCSTVSIAESRCPVSWPAGQSRSRCHLSRAAPCQLS